MHHIDFNENMTLFDLLTTFAKFKEKGETGWVVIDGQIILSTSDDLQNRLTNAYTKYHEKQNKFLKEYGEDRQEIIRQKYDEKLQEATQKHQDAVSLSNNPIFLFEIGLVLKYTKEHLQGELLKYYVLIYSDRLKNTDGIEKNQNLRYMTNLLLIIDQDLPLSQKQFQIQQIINSICNDEIEMYKLKNAIEYIAKYTILGDQIKELMFFNSLDGILKQTEKEVNIVLKRLQS